MNRLMILLNAFFLFAFSFSQTEVSSIRFGSGGGFTGSETVYSIDQSGQIFNIHETLDGKNNTFLKFVGKKTAKPFFQQAKELQDYHYNSPADTYSFIEFRGAESFNKIAWGDSAKVDARVLSMYNNLMALIN